jgi:hypothetical protein
VARTPGIFRPWYTEPGPHGRVRRTSSQWAYRFEFEGRTYQKAGFDTASAASKARDQRRSELRAGHEQDWRKLTVHGLHQMAAARKVEWDASTGESFDRVWKRLLRFFRPEDRAASIDDTRLLEFVGFRKAEGAARNTIRLDLTHLKMALTIAHRKRVLPWVPQFPTLKQERREQTVASIELRQIVAEMPEHYRLFFAAAEEMGWRARSELRTRRWKHVDFGPASWQCCGAQLQGDVCACGAGRPGWVYLDAASSKTDSARMFPMTRRLRAILVEALERWERVRVKAGRMAPWVFMRDDGLPIGDYRSAWRTALKRLGVGKIPGRKGPWSSARVVHDIRRTAIRRMKHEGVTREDRKQLVGHASDTAHAAYEARQDLEAMREAARLLDQRRGEAEPDTKVVQLSLFRRLR